MSYALTIFLSSFLLFLVQPLIARLILPWFGGTAAVWTTCMLFFQTVLLAGYAYAHGTNAKLRPKSQAILHVGLLAASLLVLPIMPAEGLKPAGDEEPISRILLLLAVTVGLPYLLLSATSPLLQAWFARARPGQDPYRLFAISNLASLLALIGYPVVVEPLLGNREQVLSWSWLYALFAVSCAWLSIASYRAHSAVLAQPAAAEDPGAAPTGRDYALWLALSATGSVLLLAVTNHVTQNVAAIPLLWLAPLTLYLLTFILAFEGRGLYRPQVFWSLVMVWLGGMTWLLVDTDHHFDLGLQAGMFLSGLFIGCMFCHGELYLTRPAARHLTAFYLTVSAGGALGGVLVAIVAPLAFKGYYELSFGLVVLAVLAALRYKDLHLAARWSGLAMIVVVTGGAIYEATWFQRAVLETQRSFYGVLRVKEYGRGEGENQYRRLVHGVIMHGEQNLKPGENRKPTTYYTETSGIGGAIAAKKEAGPVRVGVVGLGVGTLAAYGRQGDVYRFYEINPQVLDMAGRLFTYLRDSAAAIEIRLGDARLAMEKDPPANLDVLAIDAFSSDAIPAHLITKEALGVYLRHVKPDGIIAFHVSNRFLNLVPVVARIAREHGLAAVLVTDEGKEGDADHTKTDWVLLSRQPKALQAPGVLAVNPVPAEDNPAWRTWTDDYSNLVQILK